MIKSFQVDTSSVSEMEKLINRLRSLCGSVRSRNGEVSRAARNGLVFDACVRIMQADISEVYTNKLLDSNPKYYVYAHLNEGKKIAVGSSGVTTFAATLGMAFFPFYVGKGTGNRCYDLSRNETHRKVRDRLNLFDSNISTIKLFQNLSESEALQIESKLIDIFGLMVDGGMLANLDEGLHPETRRRFYAADFASLRGINKRIIKESSVKADTRLSDSGSNPLVSTEPRRATAGLCGDERLSTANVVVAGEDTWATTGLCAERRTPNSANHKSELRSSTDGSLKTSHHAALPVSGVLNYQRW